MLEIKINSTKIRRKGALFHYAPFVLHCLFPEIINKVYEYNNVYRIKDLDHTIGNLSKIYTELMNNNNIELDIKDYHSLDLKIIDCEFDKSYLNREYFDTFRNFIFTRYKINANEYDSKYPEVLLIKRSNHIELIDDPMLKTQLPPPPANISERFIDGIKLRDASPEALRYHFLVTNGKDRREMDRIDDVDLYLSNKFGNKFKSVFFEFVPFEEQVRYYNNAKVIICVHGGCQVNQFFCKESTKILEVESNGKEFLLFDQISDVLNLQHLKCKENEYSKIIEFINTHTSELV